MATLMRYVTSPNNILYKNMSERPPIGFISFIKIPMPVNSHPRSSAQ
jgi:hypothetical protein